MMRRIFILPLFFSLGLFSACAGRSPRPTIESPLALDQVVLYRNGIGYFERSGKVDGDRLRLRVRKDQVDDLLKSLTVVDTDGKAVSISMPLDPASWASAAMHTLAPGRGSLAEMLDSLRGREVSLVTRTGRLRGRIAMVERIEGEPDPDEEQRRYRGSRERSREVDHKVSLLVGRRMEVLRLSKVRSVVLHDGDLAMQLHRTLDASAGEGMFEEVEIELRLTGARSHDLRVSYVVEAPMWKPTYRVVLPEGREGKALLQGWAVVDNVSGEDWSDISLSLTSGAPIAFSYDLHTPREVPRRDLTESGVHKRAEVAMGEVSLPEEEMAAALAEDMEEEMAVANEPSRSKADKKSRPASKSEAKPAVPQGAPGGGLAGTTGRGRDFTSVVELAPTASRDDAGLSDGPRLDQESLQRSMQVAARAQRISGLTRVDLDSRVTVPEGSSTMVALINAQVEAEETFLYRPEGAGQGYESNPYRVLRFRNGTDYVLEPGPISIYSGGSFVGEALSEAVGAGASVTIPFAVEPSIMLSSSRSHSGQEMRIVRILRGVLEVESFYRVETKWELRGPAKSEPYRVLVRHPRQGAGYELKQPPKGTEDLDGAYLVPIEVPKGAGKASVTVVEETPSKLSLSIWDQRAPKLLDSLLAVSDLDAKMRARLQPIVDLRREIGRIDTEIDGFRRQQGELDRRARETRRNLEAIKKDSKATALRKKLSRRLDEFTREADAMGRKIVERDSLRLEKKIALEDLLQDLDLRR